MRGRNIIRSLIILTSQYTKSLNNTILGSIIYAANLLHLLEASNLLQRTKGRILELSLRSLRRALVILV